MLVPALETVTNTQEIPLVLVEKQSQSTWLTCMVERLATARVELNVKY